MNEARETSLNRLLAEIYDAALGELTWEVPLGRITSELNATTGIVFSMDPSTEEMHWSHSTGLSESAEQEYTSHFAAVDPLLPPAISQAGLAAPDHALIPRRVYESSEIYNDYLQKIGLGTLLGSVFLCTPKRIAALSVLRDVQRGLFSAQETARLTMLVPHLIRAIRIADLIEREQWRALALHRALDLVPFGVVLLQPGSRVLDANAGAVRILATCPGANLRRGQLRLDALPSSQHLRKAIAVMFDRMRVRGTAPCAFMTLERPWPLRPLRVAVLPFHERCPMSAGLPRPTVAVCLFDGETGSTTNTDVLQTLFGLTVREAQIGLHLAQGRTLRETADELAITLETARSHLKHALHKTGAKNQGALIRMIVTSPIQVLRDTM